MARICLILTAQWKSRKGNTYAGSPIALANPYAVNLDGCLTWRAVASGETVALPINSLPDGDVTFSCYSYLQWRADAEGSVFGYFNSHNNGIQR